MDQQPRKRWPRRHPVLSTLITFTVLGFSALIAIGAALNSAASQIGHANSASPTHAPGNTGQAQHESDPAPSTPPASSGPVHLAVGDSAVITDNIGDTTEGSVKVSSINVTTQPADPEFGEAPAHGYYVIVHIHAKADRSYTDGFDVNSLDFFAQSHGRQFQEDNGHAYEALSDDQSSEDITNTLAAGNSSEGWIAFDVNHPHGQIVYAPNLDGQPLAVWNY